MRAATYRVHEAPSTPDQHFICTPTVFVEQRGIPLDDTIDELAATAKELTWLVG